MSEENEKKYFQVPMNWNRATKERILPDAYYLCKTNLDERGEKPWSVMLGSSIEQQIKLRKRPYGCPIFVARITDPEALSAGGSIALKHNLQKQTGLRRPRPYTLRRVLEGLHDQGDDDRS